MIVPYYTQSKIKHMKSFEEKVVVITGGNSGIGLAAAKQFKDSGARVIINARSESRREESIQSNPGLYDHVLVADLSDLGQTKQFIETAGALYGKIDVLYLNAGIAHFRPVEEIDTEHFNAHFDLNVKSLLFSVQYALPFLSEGAAILTTTSVVNQKGMPAASVYSATKAAVKSITQVLAIELADRGIRINAISPGPIETPIFGKMGLNEEDLNATAQGILQQVPLNRFGSADEVAALVLQVAGNAYITGQELVVDGGMAAV
jgi:NAD(P)-dependent dehydrogenase (short-subunit alcohol dehydrogenase family)